MSIEQYYFDNNNLFINKKKIIILNAPKTSKLELNER